jgi:hypothetical protein
MSTYMQCPLKHYLAYTAGLVEPPEQRRPGLALGSAFHKMLEARYLTFKEADQKSRPRDIEQANVASWQALGEMLDSGREVLSEDQRTSLEWMLDGYNETYGTEYNWEILDVERPVETPLCTLNDGREIKLIGRIDLVVREKSRVWLVDFKTMRGKNASAMAWVRERDLDWQFTLYQALMVRDAEIEIARGERDGTFWNSTWRADKPAGAIYAAIRTDALKRQMTSDERFGRHIILRSPASLERALQNAEAVVRHMAAVQDPINPLPVFSAPDPQMCGWKCSYREVHLHADATGRDYAEVAADWGFVPKVSPETPAKASVPESEVDTIESAHTLV